MVADSERVVVVSAGAPGTWQIELDERGDAYVVALRSPGQREEHLLVRLPRRVIDKAVLAASGIALELTPEGRIAAYAGSGGVGTLARSALSTLVADAVAPDSLTVDERPTALTRLEAELEQALEAVRRARAS